MTKSTIGPSLGVEFWKWWSVAYVFIYENKRLNVEIHCDIWNRNYSRELLIIIFTSQGFACTWTDHKPLAISVECKRSHSSKILFLNKKNCGNIFHVKFFVEKCFEGVQTQDQWKIYYAWHCLTGQWWIAM